MNFRYEEDINRTFRTALLFSAVLHVFLLFNWPFYRHLFTEKRKPGDIEITYIRAAEPQQRTAETNIRRSLPQPEVSQPEKLVSQAKPEAKPKPETAAKTPAPPAKAKPDAEEAKAVAPKEQEAAPKVVIKQPLAPKMQATASVDGQGLKLMPLSYSQAVRNKIINNLDTMKSGVEGEVCVRFVVFSDGKLKDLSIIDEKSSDNGFLRSAAFRAVRDAAPFAPFPAGTDFPEIAFTCEISFSSR